MTKEILGIIIICMQAIVAICGICAKTESWRNFWFGKTLMIFAMYISIIIIGNIK